MDKNYKKTGNAKPEEIKFNIHPIKVNESNNIFDSNSIITTDCVSDQNTYKNSDKKKLIHFDFCNDLEWVAQKNSVYISHDTRQMTIGL